MVCRDWSRPDFGWSGPWDYRHRKVVAEWFRQLAPHRDNPAGDLLRRVYVGWRTNGFSRVFLWADEFASGAEDSAWRVCWWTRRHLDICRKSRIHTGAQHQHKASCNLSPATEFQQ